MTTPAFSQRVSQLLEPINAESPCGTDLGHDAVFDRLKELRREDDTSLPMGAWSPGEVKRADWAKVEYLASDVIKTRSKHLMLAAWLGEAWLHRGGLEGVADALALLDGLCERYPDDVHPQWDEDYGRRAAPLQWMARRYDEILLTRLQLFPETPAHIGNFSLYTWRQMKQRQVQINDSKPAKVAAEAAQALQQQVNDEVRRTPLAWWLQGLKSLEAAKAWLILLDGWCDRHLGDERPSFSALRKQLDNLESLLREFISLHPPQALPAEPEAARPEPEKARAPIKPSAPATEPGSRDEAYRQLQVIADYLARIEPHSPVPYLIRRGVEWGNQPLPELLAQLHGSDVEARRLWALLGVL